MKISMKRVFKAGIGAAFLASSFVFSAMPVAAQTCLQGGSPVTTCTYNSTQGTCTAPVTGGGQDCTLISGTHRYASSSNNCVADPRSCATNQRFNCATALCECNTSAFPCGGCTAATSTSGAACSGGSCPTGGVYTNQCGATGCPAGTTNIGGACVGYANISPASPQTGYLSVTGDVRSSTGDFYLATGRAIRVDGAGVTALNIGNWGAGATGVRVGINAPNPAVAHTLDIVGNVDVMYSGAGSAIAGWNVANGEGLNGRSSGGTGVFGEGAIGGRFYSNSGTGVIAEVMANPTNTVVPVLRVVRSITGNNIAANGVGGSIDFLSGAAGNIGVGRIAAYLADTSASRGAITFSPTSGLGAYTERMRIETSAVSLQNSTPLTLASSVSDPGGVSNGSMIYNSASGKFRCYEAGVWKDCVGGGVQGSDIENGSGGNVGYWSGGQLYGDNNLYWWRSGAQLQIDGVGSTPLIRLENIGGGRDLSMVFAGTTAWQIGTSLNSGVGQLSPDNFAIYNQTSNNIRFLVTADGKAAVNDDAVECCYNFTTGGNTLVAVSGASAIVDVEGRAGRADAFLNLRRGIDDRDNAMVSFGAYDGLGSFWYAGMPYDGGSATDASHFIIARADYVTDSGGTDRNPEFIIETGGNVGIGTVAPAYKLEITGSAGKPGGGSWTSTSDARTKKDVSDFSDGLAVLERMQPVRYTYNGLAGTPEGQEGVGFIAQEVRDVAPYLVRTRMTKLHPGDTAEVEVLSIDPSAMDFINMNAIKELNAKLQVQQSEIEALEARLKSLENKLK